MIRDFILDDDTLLQFYILHVLILIHCYKYVAEKKIENSAGAKKLLMTIRCRKHRALQPVVVLPSSSYPTGYSTSIVRSFFSIKNPNPTSCCSSIAPCAILKHLTFLHQMLFLHCLPFYTIFHSARHHQGIVGVLRYQLPSQAIMTMGSL